MATVLECVTIPRSSASPVFSPAKFYSTSVSSISGFRGFAKFKGFKVRPIRSFGSVTQGSSSSWRLRHGGRIVCEAQKTTVDVAAVTEATWKSLVLDSEIPVLVEFWAPWCGPCRMILPIIEELSRQYAGKLKCYKINTDENPSIATNYGIKSIPTVIIFKNGEKKEAVIGAVPKSTFTTSIEKFL